MSEEKEKKDPPEDFQVKVLHIIPNAFGYFKDIKDTAFGLVENLNGIGIKADAFTLEYGTSAKVMKKQEKEVQKVAPTRKYLGMFGLKEMINNFGDYHIIHLHCPLLGGSREICRFKKRYPILPLVVTYYRPVKTPDLFSLFVKAYNAYYLPKIFGLADAVTSLWSFEKPNFWWSKKWRKKENARPTVALVEHEEFVHLTQTQERVELVEQKLTLSAVQRLLKVYSECLAEKAEILRNKDKNQNQQ